MNERLRLADLLGGLSIAADLGFGLPPEEAMRWTYFENCNCDVACPCGQLEGRGAVLRRRFPRWL